MRYMRLAMLIAAAVVLRAQPAPSPLVAQETARARLLLQSNQLVDRAWGAYFAGRLPSEDLKDMLADQLRIASTLSGASTEEVALIAALFDAAIQSDASVPAAVLEALQRQWGEPVLILLSRAHDSESEDLLLKLGADKNRDLVWLAANNLLYERRSPRWYAETLGELSLTHRFRVTDSNNARGIGVGIGCGLCGDSGPTMLHGFPPITIYSLQLDPARGAVVLARGPEDVYYRRTVFAPGQGFGFGSCYSHVDPATVQIGYVAALAGIPSTQAEKLFHQQTEIRYAGIDDFNRRVEQSFRSQETAIRTLFESIDASGLHTPTGQRMRITPEVDDQRETPQGSLPYVPSRDVVLN
jgi:hypothetical protein